MCFFPERFNVRGHVPISQIELMQSDAVKWTDSRSPVTLNWDLSKIWTIWSKIYTNDFNIYL